MRGKWVQKHPMQLHDVSHGLWQEAKAVKFVEPVKVG